MYLDFPKFNKCCFCIPLRRGLIAWGYISLILLILILIPLMTAVVFYFYNANVSRKDFVLCIIFILITFVNIFMTILFLRATHVKNWKLLRVYYYYYICIVTLSVVTYFVGMGYEAYNRFLRRTGDLEIWWETLLYLFMIGFAHFAIQTYVVLLIRSELLKLQDHYEFRFVKKCDESECMLNVHDEPTS